MPPLHHRLALLAILLGTSAGLTAVAWSLTHDVYPAERRAALDNLDHEPGCHRVVVDNLVAPSSEQASRLERARYLGPCLPEPSPIRV